MANPVTRSALQTRALAVRVELRELADGARVLAGGLDAGTQRQRDACDGLVHRFDEAAQDLAPAGVTDTIYGVA
jgi:hypothetical protein